MTICRPCIGLPCDNPADLASGIDSALYSAQDYSFIVQCPDGCYCPPGVFPQTISILASTIPPVIPPIIEPGMQIILQLQGCQSLIIRTLPAGSSQDAISQAAQSMQAEWAGQQAQCLAAQQQGVNCTAPIGDQLSVCNDAQTINCGYIGIINVPAGTSCDTLITTGLTSDQIAAAVAALKTRLNFLAANIFCPWFHVICDQSFTDQTGHGTEWTLIVNNESATKSFDSSGFQCTKLDGTVLQNSLQATIAPGALGIVVLDAQPGTPPNGFQFRYFGAVIFTYPNNLNGHNVRVIQGVNCGP